METRLSIVVLLLLLSVSLVGAEKVYAPISVYSNGEQTDITSGSYTTSFNCSGRYDTEFFVPVEANLDEVCQGRVVSCQEHLGLSNNRLIEQQNKTLMLEEEKKRDSWLNDFNGQQMLMLVIVWMLAISLIVATVFVIKKNRYAGKNRVEVYTDGRAEESGGAEASGK